MKNQLRILLLVLFAVVSYACTKEGTTNGEDDDARIESSTVKDASVICELLVPHNVKTQKFRIRCDDQWQVRFTEDCDWIRITPMFGDEGETEITVSTLPNDTPQERSFEFILAGRSNDSYKEETYRIVQCAGNTDENGFVNIITSAPGTLEAELDKAELPFPADSLTRLRISGSLNDEDCRIIQEKLTKLVALDLRKAVIPNLPPHFFCWTPVAELVLPEGLSSMASLFYKYPEGGGLILGSAVKAVIIPKNSPITNIPPSEFKYCLQLRYIELPDGLRTIDDEAFMYASIEAITLPANLTSIGSGAFWNTSIKAVEIPEKVQTIKSGAFCYSNLAKVTFKGQSALTDIGSRAFGGCYRLEEFVFPERLLQIGSYAFEDTRLKKAVLPRTLRYIGTGAFAGTLFESVNIPAGCQFDAPFMNCPNLRSITIEGDLYSNSAPSLNEPLQRIVFLKSVANIHMSLLERCSDIREIVLNNPTPPAITYSHLYPPTAIFPKVSRRECVLKIPRGSSAAYKADRIWGTFENIEEQL